MSSGSQEADSRIGQRVEARFAHISQTDGELVGLCGYVGVRLGTIGEAQMTGLCVVCLELYEVRYGHPWPYSSQL